MKQHKHDDPKLAAYKRFGSIIFYCGFLSGLLAAGALLYAEMAKMNKSLFEALAGDSAVTLSLIAAFMAPLSLGWIARFLISGQRY